MVGYVADIEKETLENDSFRKVLYTGPQSQLVVMSIAPGEDIGMEVHEDHDQFIRIESGAAKVVLNGEESLLKEDFAVVIPAGAQHNVINTSATEELKLYTIYAPPEHKDGTIHRTKQDAQEAHE